MPKLVNPIPDSFDSAKEWPKCAKLINDIRDQSNCGCCWAFGAAEAERGSFFFLSQASWGLPTANADGVRRAEGT